MVIRQTLNYKRTVIHIANKLGYIRIVCW